MIDYTNQFNMKGKKNPFGLGQAKNEVLRLSTSNPVASRKPDTRSLHQKLTSEIRVRPLQLWRIYHKRRTLKKTKTAGKTTRNKPCVTAYVRLSMQSHHSAVQAYSLHAITAPHLE